MNTESPIMASSEAGQSWRLQIGWSVYLGAALMYVWFSSRDLYRLAPQAGFLQVLAIPLVPIGILLGSVLAHELGHAFAMETAGIRVRRIGLEIWGGYTEPEGNVSLFKLPAGRYFWTTFLGPATNLFVAGFVWAVVLGSPSIAEMRATLTAPHSLLPFFVTWSVLVNILLGLTNLLPLFPLDGGHVFRALIMGVVGGTVLPTLISGGLSLAAGIFGVWWVTGAIRGAGWDALSSTWLIGLYSAVVVVGSLMALSSVFERDA